MFSGNADSHLSAKLIVLRCVTGMEHAISCKYMDIYVSACPFQHTSALLVLQNVLQSNDMNCTTPSAGMRGYYQVIAAFFAWTFGGSSRLLGYTRHGRFAGHIAVPVINSLESQHSNIRIPSNFQYMFLDIH